MSERNILFQQNSKRGFCVRETNRRAFEISDEGHIIKLDRIPLNSKPTTEAFRALTSSQGQVQNHVSSKPEPQLQQLQQQQQELKKEQLEPNRQPPPQELRKEQQKQKPKTNSKIELECNYKSTKGPEYFPDLKQFETEHEEKEDQKKTLQNHVIISQENPKRCAPTTSEGPEGDEQKLNKQENQKKSLITNSTKKREEIEKQSIVIVTKKKTQEDATVKVNAKVAEETKGPVKANSSGNKYGNILNQESLEPNKAQDEEQNETPSERQSSEKNKTLNQERVKKLKGLNEKACKTQGKVPNKQNLLQSDDNKPKEQDEELYTSAVESMGKILKAKINKEETHLKQKNEKHTKEICNHRFENENQVVEDVTLDQNDGGKAVITKDMECNQETSKGPIYEMKNRRRGFCLRETSKKPISFVSEDTLEINFNLDQDLLESRRKAEHKKEVERERRLRSKVYGNRKKLDLSSIDSTNEINFAPKSS